MYTMQEKLKFKEDIMKCIHVCGAITGKYMKLLCPDDEFIFELMKAEKIRRIPVEVVRSDKSKYKMYIFEAVSRLKPTKFPNQNEDNARVIALSNKHFIDNQNVTWLGLEDVTSFAASSCVSGKLVPAMMYYKDSQLYAVYFSKKAFSLSEKDKDAVSNKLNVDNVIEYLF